MSSTALNEKPCDNDSILRRTTTSSTTVPCWTRFWWELRHSYPMFSLDEPVRVVSGGDNNNTMETRPISVASSFGPYRRCYATSLVRAMMLGWSLHVLYVDVSHYPPHNLYIYMGYLTHWGHFLSNAYFFSSLLCTLLPGALRQPSSSSQSSTTTKQTSPPPPSESPTRLVKFTWGLYSLVAPLEIAITMLYWSAVDGGGPTYITVMEHGGVAALVLFDGLIVGLVPMRVKHVLFLLLVCIAYLSWSIVDAVLEIGNGEWGPAYGDDDALYSVLNWNDNRKGAAIVSAFTICVLAPCIFVACWLLSLVSLATKNTPTITTDFETATHERRRCCRWIRWDGSRRVLESNAVKTIEAEFEYKHMGGDGSSDMA